MDQKKLEGGPKAYLSKAATTEHSIYLLYPLRWARRRSESQASVHRKRNMAPRPSALPHPETTLKALIEASWQPNKISEEMLREIEAKRRQGEEQRSATKEQQRNDNIWAKAVWSVAQDMDVQVVRLLSQEESNRSVKESDKKVNVWALSHQNNVRHALMGRSGGIPIDVATNLAIKFSPAAVRRLQARLGPEPPEAVKIEFGEVRALTFRTGYGLLVAEVYLGSKKGATSISMPVLVEAAVALCHDRQLKWLRHDGVAVQSREGEEDISLRVILGTLLGDYANQGITTARAYSYIFAKLDDAIAPMDRSRFLVQLACKYTDDYRIDPAAYSDRIFEPFESITHLATLEGSATIIENIPLKDRDRAQFLQDYGTNSIEPRYLPLVVLSHHAFIVLLNLIQESRAWIDIAEPSTNDVARLQRLRDRMLEFRLFHRLYHVSLLTMPNEFQNRLARAFGLERMLTIADRDVAEIGAILDARRRQAEAHRSAWFRRLTAMTLAIIAGATLGKIVAGAFGDEHCQWINWINVCWPGVRDHVPWLDDALCRSIRRLEPWIELSSAAVFGVLAFFWFSEHGALEKDAQELVHMREYLE